MFPAFSLIFVISIIHSTETTVLIIYMDHLAIYSGQLVCRIWHCQSIHQVMNLIFKNINQFLFVIFHHFLLCDQMVEFVRGEGPSPSQIVLEPGRTVARETDRDVQRHPPTSRCVDRTFRSLSIGSGSRGWCQAQGRQDLFSVYLS